MLPQLIKQDYSAEKAKVLNQEGTFNEKLSWKFEKHQAEHITSQPEFQEVLGLVEQLKKQLLMLIMKQNLSEQLDQIISLTDQIKETFKK